MLIFVLLSIRFAARRFQAPLIAFAAVAPLFCLIDDMNIKQTFATLHFVANGGVMGSCGVIIFIALGFVITETEQIANKTDATVKALKNMKLMKSKISFQAFQNSVLNILFAFWPFLQVRASWLMIIFYPLSLHCLVIPLATYIFWPKDKKRKVAPDSNRNSTAAQMAEVNTCWDDNDDDYGADGGEGTRPTTRVPVQKFAHG